MDWNLLKERLIENLSSSEELLQRINIDSYRRASVLILLFSYRDEAYILFTQRSANLKQYPGEVCFPGGKMDSNDNNAIDTALRETYEEIGLHPSHVEVLCELIPFHTKTGIAVSPVVGFIKNTKEISLQINSEEVADIFACPLALFLNEPNYGVRQATYKGSSYILHQFHWHKNQTLYDEGTNNFYQRVLHDLAYETFTIFGLTALLSLLVACIGLKAPALLKDAMLSPEDLTSNMLNSIHFMFGAKL